MSQEILNNNKPIYEHPLIKENKEIFEKYELNFISAIDKNLYMQDKGTKGFYQFMRDFYSFLYTSIHGMLAKNKYKEQFESLIRTHCKYIKEKILPVCYSKIDYYKKNIEKDRDNSRLYSLWVDMEDDFYALAAYRDLKMFALYYERERKVETTKIFTNEGNIFDAFFYYAEKMIFEKKIPLLRASYFPGAGKTYAMNIISAFWFGYDEQISILRITYSSNKVKEFIESISGIIFEKNFRKVFPKFDLGVKQTDKQLYKNYISEDGFQFTFSKNRSYYAATRDGQITSKRAKVLMTDDLLKGADEAPKIQLNKDICSKYQMDWQSRADSDYQPTILAGTMWSSYDLLNFVEQNVVKELEAQGLTLQNDDKFKYVKLAINNKNKIIGVFIAVPILDYITDESTSPLRYSTEKMRKKREESIDKDLFQLVYQQNTKITTNKLWFDSTTLDYYTNETVPRQLIPKTIENRNAIIETRAYMDPTRKGTDKLCVVFLKRYLLKPKLYSKWYLVDVYYKSITFKEARHEIYQLIKRLNVNKFDFESNTDTNLDLLIRKELRETGCYNCRITPHYTTMNKEYKIRQQVAVIKGNVLFPMKGVFAKSNMVSEAMQDLFEYTPDGKGNFDDFPDCLSMFSMYVIDQKEERNKIFSINNLRGLI